MSAPITIRDKLEAVTRELGFRHRVYANRVANGTMTQRLADRQIAIFEAIEADYRKLEQGERLI